MTTHTITCTWNGSTVLEGKATAAMAYNIARQFIGENFTGLDHKVYMRNNMPPDRLERIAAKHACAYVWHYTDETGDARVTIA